MNGIATCAFEAKEELLSYLGDQEKILVAINTEKILRNDPQLRDLINENIGYPDGIGAVMALRRKGVKAVKIAGAQLWLEDRDALLQAEELLPYRRERRDYQPDRGQAEE